MMLFDLLGLRAACPWLLLAEQDEGRFYCRAIPLRGHDGKASEAFQKLSLGCMLRRWERLARRYFAKTHAKARALWHRPSVAPEVALSGLSRKITLSKSSAVRIPSYLK